MGMRRNIIDRAARAMGESADKYGIPAKLGWKSTDGTTVYTSAAGGPMHYKVRMGQAGEQRVVAVAHDLGMPDVYDLDILVAFQDGTAIIVDWDRSAPIIPPPGGSLACASCGETGGVEALILTGALYLPDLETEPDPPDSGAILYSYQGVARVVDSNGARDL